MFVVCLIVSLFLFGVVYYSEKELYNPTVFFIGFYGFTGFISGLHILGMFNPTDYTYYIVLVSLFFFFIGYLVSKRIKYREQRLKIKEFNIKVYRVLVYGSLLFGVAKLRTIIPLIRQGVSLDYIRTVYNGQTVKGISFSSIIYQGEAYFCKPCIQLIIPIFCILITNKELKRKVPKSIIILSAIDILVNQVVSGGRVSLFAVLVLMLVSLKLQYGIRIRDIIAKHFKIFLILMGILVLMYWITVQRSSSSLIASVFYYFCAPLVALSKNLDSIVGIGAERSYGLALLSGFVRPIYVVFRNIFGLNLHPMDIIYDMHREVNTYFNIGQNTRFNAFVTLFYYFYLDGGLAGVAIDSFIYSVFCNGAYNSSRVKRDMFSNAIYLLVFQGLMLSFVRYQYIDVGNALAFGYLLLVFTGKNKSIVAGAIE